MKQFASAERQKKQRHSGMDAGIYRPRMANYDPLRCINQTLAHLRSYHPWHWIPAFPAGMTGF
jgi:hypothetical protein